MIFSVPVNDASEVPALAEAGAGELYCGLQEAWWTERYGNHDSISRRQGRANLGSREELAAATAAARIHGLPLFLALNGQYDEHQLDYLVELADDFERMGGTGIIARDLGLFLRLDECGNRLKRVCSILATCANALSVEAFARLGVSRIVFPRFLGAEEIAAILHAGSRTGSRMEAESMVFFDKCPLVDGYCTHYHGVSYPDRVGKDAGLPGEPLYTFDTTYRTHACLGKSCEYLDPYPCAACELAHLEQSGVRFGKLGGRGRPLAERVRALEFLHRTQGLSSDDDRKRQYREVFGQSCACYYGRSAQDRTAIEPLRLHAVPNRVYVGDARDGSKLRDSIRALLDVGLSECGVADTEKTLTLLMGPLSQSELEPRRWDSTIKLLLHCLPTKRFRSIHLCANDVGTLVALECMRARMAESLGRAWDGELVVTAGPLLTRGDKPAEFEHFLSPEQNLPRPVWDVEGRPRVLTYRSIASHVTSTDEGRASDVAPRLLWDHWDRMMGFAMRTSYQQALARIVGHPIDAEF